MQKYEEEIEEGMDGPNVNWKFYDSMVEERIENDYYPGFIDVG